MRRNIIQKFPTVETDQKSFEVLSWKWFSYSNPSKRLKNRHKSSYTNKFSNPKFSIESPSNIFKFATSSFNNSPFKSYILYTQQKSTEKTESNENYKSEKKTNKDKQNNFQIKNSAIPKFGNNIKLSVKGRPLTATGTYKEIDKLVQRPQSYAKKRESLFSYGDSEDFSPLDPKFYDEEYTHLDEYTQLLLSQPVNPISPNSNEKTPE